MTYNNIGIIGLRLKIYTFKLFVANSTPIVGLLSKLNSSFVNRDNKLDYSLNKRSIKLKQIEKINIISK